MNDHAKPEAKSVIDYDNLQFHELAKWFDPLEGEDFDNLVDSIRHNDFFSASSCTKAKSLRAAIATVHARPRVIASRRGTSKISHYRKIHSNSYLLRTLRVGI
jgi:hypothetical protein